MSTELFFEALKTALGGQQAPGDLVGKKIHFVVYGAPDERWELSASPAYTVARTEAEEADLTLFASPQELERMLTTGSSTGLRFIGDQSLLARMLDGGAPPSSPLGLRIGGGS